MRNENRHGAATPQRHEENRSRRRGLVASWRSLTLLGGVGLLLAASCNPVVNGSPADASALGESSCMTDVDCGSGRHCTAAGVCGIDCVTSADCAFELPANAPNDLVCSLCGRCVAQGTRDSACLGVTDQPCQTDSDCVASLGAGNVCNAGLCARVCSTNDDCQPIGRGYGCENSLCVQTCFQDQDCWYFGFAEACTLPAGVDPVANANSPNPVFGSCSANPNGPGFTPTGNMDPPSAQYQGVWGWLGTSAVVVSGLPVVTQLNSVSIDHILVRITFNGPDLVFLIKWCSESIQDFLDDDGPVAPLFSVVVPDLNVDSILTHTFTAQAVPAMTAGAMFTTGQVVDIRGAKLTNPATDPLPSQTDMTNEWDQDRDGHPGMTTNVTGALSGDVYQTQRWIASFNVKVFDADHLGGLVPTVSAANTLGASDPTLLNNSVTTQHPDTSRTYFHAVRMADDATCNDVITLGQTQGNWIAFQPHYDPNQMP